MISICVVTLDRLNDYFDIFLESIQEKTKYVKEVLIVNVDQESDFYKTWQVGDIVFKMFGGK